ncbi:MAG: hypothetical protein WBQ73_02185, partial [Candidatus Babeliales bacterium]
HISRGIVTSTAIFNRFGSICGWTSWQPFYNYATSIHAFGLQNGTQTTSFLLRSSKDPNLYMHHVTHWKHTLSEPSHETHKKIVNQLQEYKNKKSLNVTAVCENSPLLFTAYGNTIVCSNYITGTMSILSNTTLSKIAPLKLLSVYTIGEKQFLFAGGVHGIAWTEILPPSSPQQSCSTGHFNEDLSYQRVKKFCYDAPYFYILSPEKLDRIHETELSQLAQKATCIASCSAFHIFSFNDFIVSGNFGILGTSNGLYRTCNEGDIRFQPNNDISWWTHILPPHKNINVLQFLTFSATHNSSDFARYQGSTVYAVIDSKNGFISDIHRYAIAPTENAPISDDTMSLLPDYYFFPHAPPFFATLGAHSHSFFTDGNRFLYIEREANHINLKPIEFPIKPVRNHALNAPLTNHNIQRTLLLNSMTGNICIADDSLIFLT